MCTGTYDERDSDALHDFIAARQSKAERHECEKKAKGAIQHSSSTVQPTISAAGQSTAAAATATTTASAAAAKSERTAAS